VGSRRAVGPDHEQISTGPPPGAGILTLAGVPIGRPEDAPARLAAELAGADVIAGQFARWFGDTEDFELVEATVGDVAGRLHLHWRLRLRAERLGNGWFTVEQQAYADAAADGRIVRLDLLCTGYRPEADNG